MRRFATFGLGLTLASLALGTRAQLTAACTHDDRLSRAAAELLLGTPLTLGSEALTAAVRGAGSDAVALHAHLSAADAPLAADDTRWLLAQRQRADAELTCGEAQSEHGRLLIVSARGGTLAPIEPAEPIVRGELAAGFARAELVVAGGDGRLVRFGVSAAALRQGVARDDTEPLSELPLPWHVQLVATGPAGPRPVAERWAGGGPEAAQQPASASASAPSGAAAHKPGVVSPEAKQAASDASQRAASAVRPAISPSLPMALARLVEGLRASRRRPRLRDNRLLREEATEHARAVCSEGRVAHELQPGHGPTERLARAGLSASLLGEAIARAVDAEQALEALQRSPSHLLTLLEPRFTDFGVGMATDASGERCFVVMLCAWPRFRGRSGSR